MVLEVVASNAKTLEVAANKWAKELKFKNADVNTRARVTTWVDADGTEKISMCQDVENEVVKQPKTLKDDKQKTLATMGKEEDFLISTRPIWGGNMADHILFSVPTRELLMSGNKQAINMTEKTPVPGHGGWVRQTV